MADASSIRKAATLPTQAQAGAPFYQGGIRFNTDQAWVNTGSQWAPLGNVVISIPIPLTTEDVDSHIFVADRAYKVVSVTESHITKSGSTNAAATAVLGTLTTADKVDHITVDTAGTLYTTVPTVTLSAPPVGEGNVRATAHATIDAGGVATIVVDNVGAGYLVAPTVTITGGNAVTVDVKQCTPGTAPASGATVLAAPLSDNTTENTPQSASVLTTSASTVAAGNTLALDVTGSVGNYAGGVVTVTLRPL